MPEKPTHKELKQRIHDATGRHQAEDDLWAKKKRYETLLESIKEAYFEVDLKGNFTFFNDSLSVILGYSRDELMGMNNRDYMPPETAKEMLNLFNQIYRTGKPIRKYGYEVIKKDGTRGFHELFASLMLNRNGNPIGFRGIAHDITKRKLAEDEREKLIDELQDALAKALSGLLPICSYCKKIRDENNCWNHLEKYLQDYSKAQVSHGICPECAEKYYPDYNLYDE